MSDPSEVWLGLGDIELDEQGRAVVENEALLEAIRRAKESQNDPDRQEVVISVHAW